MTSAFACASLGIVPTVRHADYIGSWITLLLDDGRAIVRAASAASKATDYLLTFRPEADQPVGAVQSLDNLRVSASPEMTGA
jgi:antirestriction protein ArdC